MQRTERVLALVGDHCDLEWRLGAVPPSATGRGLYYNSLASAMERLGKAEAYRELCQPGRYSALRYYPTTEYLTCLAGAGALVYGAERVHDGMREVCRLNARAFSDSLLGRALLRLLSPDPKRLLQQGASAQRQSKTYGIWELEFPEERMAIMRMREEYVWIESAMCGAAEGTFEMIGLQVDVQCELTSPFEGTHTLRW